MYKIEVPSTIHLIFAILYNMNIWTTDNTTIFVNYAGKVFYSTYLVAITIALAAGAYFTKNEGETVFLIVAAVAAVVLIYKMWFLLWRQNEILDMIYRNGKQATDDQIEFKQTNDQLEWLMQLFRYFMRMLSCGYVFTVLQPILSGQKFAFNIAFPLDRTKNTINLWISSAFLCGGIFLLCICCLQTLLLWYLMICYVNGYKLLGCDLRNLGKSTRKISTRERQKLYLKDLIAAIRTYDEINEKVDVFTSTYSKLFFLQMATSSICICGSVYTLAFSSHENLVQDGVSCVIIGYNLFDIFVLMNLGNEIMFGSDHLSVDLYESNWIEQTESCKKCVIILTERLKRPQEIVVAKMYALNLATFTSIVNSAYSIFSILQNFREE